MPVTYLRTTSNFLRHLDPWKWSRWLVPKCR